jgi:hypothetical protein
MFVFLRDLGLRRSAAAVGSATWALNGCVVFWGLYECFTTSNATVPWALYFIRLAIIRRQPMVAAVAGVIWGLLLQNGHLELSYLWSVVIVVYLAGLLMSQLWHAAAQRKAALGQLSVVLCTIGFVALAVGAPVWVRTVDWLPDLYRVSPGIDVQLGDRLGVGGALGLIAGPGILGWHYTSIKLELQAFIGIIPLVLAVLGFDTGLRSRWALTLVAAICVGTGVVLAFGFAPAVAFMHAVLPKFGSFHLHFIVHLAHLGIALLAALGANWIGDTIERLVTARRGRVLAGVVVSSLFVAHSAQAVAAFYLTTPSQPVGAAWNFPATPLIEKAEELQSAYRVIQIRAEMPKGVWLRPMLTGRLSALYKLRGGIGYESVAPRWVFRLWRAVELGHVDSDPYYGGFYGIFYDRPIDLNLLRRLSVGLIIATPESVLRDASGVDLVQSGQLVEIYRGPDGILYRIPDALPRAYFVPGANFVDEDTALTGLINGTFDPNHKILLTEAAEQGEGAYAATTSDAIGQAQIVKDHADRLAIEVTAGSAGYLQVNDSWAPGWRATIDGKPAVLLRSNYAFRAVSVPAGTHRVEMVYRPLPELIAIGVEAVTLLSLVIAGTAIIGRRIWRPYRREGQPSLLPAV